ncbi:MgtC/SapB family protein [Ramlibacter sp. AW1]|uniref:Protein MgtC n=1 Tax=Ramlibacter aurantiacus TaxID=2801330 RepID=A0A936ZQ59_9BURK|nr:MgtC/SapB family protein [Ramlibacter aurantiacus]MBL0421696.1 MgtC/SapB family protein [Ramlibacter aurantiacus]
MDLWSRISHAILVEFSDLREVEELAQVIVRLLVAALLGALLGIERERANKFAGLRTHILVAMGSAMFVLLAIKADFDSEPISRVIQGVAAGIGFLCGGAILKSARSEHVRGLTTAAGLWMTTAIGLAAGLGHEVLAIIATVLALGVLRLEGPVKQWLAGPDARSND